MNFQDAKTEKELLKEVLHEIEKMADELGSNSLEPTLIKSLQKVLELSGVLEETPPIVVEEDVVEDIVNELLNKLEEVEAPVNRKEIEDYTKSIFILLQDLVKLLQDQIGNAQLGIVEMKEVANIVKALNGMQKEFRELVKTFGTEEYVAKRNAIGDAMREMIVVKGKAIIKTEMYKRKLQAVNDQNRKLRQLVKALVGLVAYLFGKYRRALDLEQRLIKARSEQARLTADLIRLKVGSATDDELTVIEVPFEFAEILRDIAEERHAIGGLNSPEEAEEVASKDGEGG